MGKITIQNTSIIALYVDAIVNAANSALAEGGGVCGVIFREAGAWELAKACHEYGHCDVGSAVITPGFNLKSRYIIHAVGPRWCGGVNNEPAQLYSAYLSSLELAVKNDCHSIGFPLISAGIFGYPQEEAWRVAIEACVDFFDNNKECDIDIVFAVIDPMIAEMGERIIAEVLSEAGAQSDADGKTDFILSPELDRKAEIFFRENINLLRAIVQDEELSLWNKGYYDYESGPGHEGLSKLVREQLYDRAFIDGIVVSNYGMIISMTNIWEYHIWHPTKEWIDTLSKMQIIACVAYLYKAEYSDNKGFFATTVGEGLLIPFFEGYIEKCEI